MIVLLKITLTLAVLAASELAAHGHIWQALAAVPMLVTMALVTRRYARRRSPEGAAH